MVTWVWWSERIMQETSLFRRAPDKDTTDFQGKRGRRSKRLTRTNRQSFQTYIYKVSSSQCALSRRPVLCNVSTSDSAQALNDCLSNQKAFLTSFLSQSSKQLVLPPLWALSTKHEALSLFWEEGKLGIFKLLSPPFSQTHLFIAAGWVGVIAKLEHYQMATGCSEKLESPICEKKIIKKPADIWQEYMARKFTYKHLATKS